MKKILALMLALLMVLAMAACGAKTEEPAPTEAPAVEEEAAPAEEETPAEEEEAAEVTWADYQAYLIEKASANSPDPDEFKTQVEALTAWEDIDETAAPWNLMFTTIGLSTWEEFQQGIVKDAAVAGGPDPSASGESSEEPAGDASGEPAGDASGEPAGDASSEPADNASGEPAGDASGEPAGDASGEPSGGNASADYEIEVNGVSGTAHYEDVDNGDQTTKSFVITFDGKDIPGTIDKGVWTADSGDEADQAVVDAVHAAFEGGNASGEPTA